MNKMGKVQRTGRARNASRRPAGSSKATLEKRLVEAFEGLPPQLQAAGRYLLDHPNEVALRSMRELAREANLVPATMTRLARRLGFSGFDELKRGYTEQTRRYAAHYRNKAIELADANRGEDAAALAGDMIAGIAGEVQSLLKSETVQSLVESARLLRAARTIYCLGLRLSFPAAYSFQYIHSAAGGSSVLLDAPGGSGLDPLRHASEKDAMLAITVLPYTRTTIEQANFANEKAIPVIAITDSKVSPLIRIAKQAIIVGTKSQSFFQTMVGVATAAETLATLIAMGSPQAVLDGLKSSEDYFSAANTYWSPPANRAPMLLENVRKYRRMD